MSSNKFTPKDTPIRFDSSGAFISAGLSRDDWVLIIPRLEVARRTIAAELNSSSTGASRAALAAGLQYAESIGIGLPERLIADYRRQRRSSELGRILAAAKRLRESVDRIVIVGSEADLAAARALFDACCHPYHNELGRGDRGGRPRIYFAGSDLDNDALQGLLDVLPHERAAATIDDRWAIIAINEGPTKIENAEEAGNTEKTTENVVLQVLFAALVRSCGGDSEAAMTLVERDDGCGAPTNGGPPISCPRSPTSDHRLPTSVFSNTGLLAGSVMGLDVVRLLEAGATMSERFRTAPVGDNPPLDFAGVLKLTDERSGSICNRFVPWGRGVAATATVLEHLFGARIADSESKFSDGRSQNSGLLVNLIVESVRRDRILVELKADSRDPSTGRGQQTLPNLQAASVASARAASKADSYPSVDIRLPALDESSLGQLFQMMTLSLRVLRALRA